MSKQSTPTRVFRSATMATCLLAAAAPSSLAYASSTQDAYNSCQAQLKARYGDDARVALKRTRERGSKVTVKMKVQTAGDAFFSTCIVHHSGQITLTGEDGRLFEAVAATSTAEG